MIRICVLILLFVSVCCFSACYSTGTYQSVPSEKTRYYDRLNRYTGYSETTQFGTRYYDRLGNYKGSK